MSFDEEGYLRQHPDVRTAIRAGLFRSGEDHYTRIGKLEGRLMDVAGQQLRASTNEALPPSPPITIERFAISSSGHIFIVGWMDDRALEVNGLTFHRNGRVVHQPGLRFMRYIRRDVAAHLDADPSYRFGFWGVFRSSFTRDASKIQMALHSSAAKYLLADIASWITDDQLNNLALGFLSLAEIQASVETADEAFKTVTGVIHEISENRSNKGRDGAQIFDFNLDGPVRNSIVIVLYRNSSMLFPQALTLGPTLKAIGGELIIVNNSPETFTETRHEIRRIHAALGLPLRFVQPAENLGFGGGNNLGARHARGKNLVLMNPDLFPARGEDILVFAGALGKKGMQETVLGARLLYDDGSLMHDGMNLFFDPSTSGAGTEHKTELLRVEHIGKGDPPDIVHGRASGAIVDTPAISG
ncbi:glycosyltransferase, partial [Salmonella enterica subsp. enterica serovar Uganda]|nr:glycosyltransferase [Salmonella enterica subsp. enterica serovar Uganda]